MKRCRRARDLVKARALARAIAGTDRTNIHETVKMREREREREIDESSVYPSRVCAAISLKRMRRVSNRRRRRALNGDASRDSQSDRSPDVSSG